MFSKSKNLSQQPLILKVISHKQYGFPTENQVQFKSNQSRNKSFYSVEKLLKWLIIKLSLTIFHNHGHNILRLFDVLPNFPFTTGETKRDYW